MEEKQVTQVQLHEIVTPLLEWYSKNARTLPWRQDKLPYHVWLSEIMLQQTRVEAVKNYYSRFLKALPTIQDLAIVPEDQLMKLWQGLGYYNRARNLQKAAKRVIEDFNGVFPHTHLEILGLPGIGAYTAGAIASICFELPTPAVDGNVLRVFARLLADKRCVDSQSVKQEFTQKLSAIYPKGQCGNFTQALMELGALVCVPNGMPKCDACPLAGFCVGHQKGIAQQLPTKQEKKARRQEQLTVFVLQCAEKIAVKKREQSGVLHGLWELPNIRGELDEMAALAKAAEFGAAPGELLRRTHKKHVFTHVEWDMICYFIICETQAACFTWVDEESLQNDIALPTAFQKLLQEN